MYVAKRLMIELFCQYRINGMGIPDDEIGFCSRIQTGSGKEVPESDL